MPKLLKIRDQALSIPGLFSENEGILFEVHPPQRRFKWGKAHVIQLWEDVLSAYSKRSETYFLGTLLLVDLEGGRVSVIDGQQRLTTISILLAVLRDRCEEFGLRGRASGLQRLLNRVNNDGEPVGAMVVTLQEQDRQDFVRIVKEEGSTKTHELPQGRLGDACKNLREVLQGYLEKEDDPQKELQSLCEYIQTKVMLLPLAVEDESQGYLVFDTSNTRGMRLSPSEALKARLAVIAREDDGLAEALIQKWNIAATKLENSGQPIDAMDDYLRTILSSKRGHIPKRSLDRAATRVNSPEELKAVIEDLATYIDSFLAVVAPGRKTAAGEDLRDLRNLNSQSVVFLTMVHKHSPSEFTSAVNLVLSLQLRNITFGQDSPNTFEKSWPNWARLVRNGETIQAFEEIRAHMRGDDEFRAAFEDAAPAAAVTARHVLRRLDPVSRPGSGVQPMDVEVEHILPKAVVSKLMGDKSLTPRVRQWIQDMGYEIPESPEDKKTLGEKLGKLLNMLGNQALLNTAKNRVAKDGRFEAKKEFYATQALELTKQLAECHEWGEGQIRERQKEMATLAPSIWPK